MMLQSLISYYDRLIQAEKKLPAYGWSREKISWCIVLNEDGSIFNIDDLRIDAEDKNGKKKRVPNSLNVPMFPEERTSGVKANCLWDNTAYVLGLSEKPKDTDKKYQDFWQNVQSFDSSQSKPIQTLLKFRTFWEAANRQSDKLPPEKDFLDTNVVFRCLADGLRFVHDCPEFKWQWQAVLAEYQAKLTTGQCLVEGVETAIADLHIRIKGVDDAQSSGAYIVSFNKESFESYGLQKGKNARVGTVAAFKYVTALNYLLRKGHKQRIKIGDAVTVFWAEADDNAAAEAAEAFASEAVEPSDDGKETASLASVLQQVAQGIPLKNLKPDLEPTTRLYILGLSPNAARLSVRFWYTTTLDELTRRIGQHYQDLQLEPRFGQTLQKLWALVYATVPIYQENGRYKTDTKRVSPLLAGNLARAVFTGQAYPQSLLSQVLGRMRCDGVVNFTRVALCKAVINRHIRLHKPDEKELPVSLDTKETNEAYRMGRLFAVLESIQKQANRNPNSSGNEKGKGEPAKVNATIRDRYWGAASATPALVFPSLMRNAMNHLAKIRKNEVGDSHLAAFFEKLIGEIETGMPTTWRKNLSLEDQGRFTIGYYHQRYTRMIKDESGKDIPNPTAAENDDAVITEAVTDEPSED